MNQPQARPRCVQLLPDTHAAGAENQARYLTAALHRESRFETELAYFDPGRGHAEFEAIGVPMRRFPRRHRLRYELFLRTRRIRSAYADRPPELMQTWLLEGNIFGLLATRSWPDTALIIGQRGSWNELDYPFHVRLQRLLIGRADHAISNSEGGAEFLVELGMPPERISVVPNGIPSERVAVIEKREAVRKRLGWEGRDVVVWVGRAEDPPAMAQKDFGTLLAATERLRERRPTVTLALIGLSGDEALASGFVLPEWAQPLGWTDRAPDLLNAGDLLAISSRTEGHSNVAAEALLLGLPVATTACGGHCGVVERAGGQVTPVGDPIALADAMADLLDRAPTRSGVRDAARGELSIERMAGRTVAIYDEVLSRKAGLAASGR